IVPADRIGAAVAYLMIGERVRVVAVHRERLPALARRREIEGEIVACAESDRSDRDGGVSAAETIPASAREFERGGEGAAAVDRQGPRADRQIPGRADGNR